ncbi:phage late control D family protein [Wolbachia endosymbiont (group A) of Lasioglossum malachurum]|uniref:phage late control D family protein n=1 Tax=Wolbachia endosymbiont (group A) of Lasioglossum malachurum TaxID=2954024 RepID=UPI00221F7760|nr:contractile injection system protein, VgrG/Pvc8 family [Wolbachia endosymbiont (group A) of Lasioglossum malachurum]
MFNEWHQTTLSDLVEKIANKHGYQAKVAEEFASIMISHIDQTAESDMHFLTRLAQIYGAIAKPAGGYLLFVSKGKAKSVTGKTLSTITFTPGDITNWKVRFNERNQYGSVIAYWYDYEKAETITEKVGDQEPSYILRDVYASSDLAQSAASAKLNQLMSSTVTLNITMPGSPELFAEAKINLLGFRKGVYGDWIINKAGHVIDNLGYRTILTAVMGK